MTQLDHLQVYDLTLTTRAPLFVGSGSNIRKKEYRFLSRTNQVQFLHLDAFFNLLVERNLADQYERFILDDRVSLNQFLREDCRLSEEEIASLIRYSVDASDALDERHSLRDILSFVRNPRGEAYLPGSSVKGALRTALLTSQMLQAGPLGSWEEKKTASLEGRYLNTLRCQTAADGSPKNDAVNSILRGVSLSDSTPISDRDMTLVRRYDCSVHGETRQMPLCHECVRPGTEIRMTLTLDQSVLRGSITRDSLLKEIDTFDQYYQTQYLSKFRTPANAVHERYQSCLILGGSAGFFSKSIAYPYLGAEQGLERVSEQMMRSFRRHGHHQDLKLGISPHTLKYARFKGMLYPYGVCQVKLR